MTSNRRDFLKLGGVAAAAFTTAAVTTEVQVAQAADAAPRARGMAKGLTLLQTVRDGKPRLAVKTKRGIIDVADASKQLNMGAPATMDELLQNEDGPRLNALVAAAESSSSAASLFKPETGIAYAPAVSKPEKIVCIGLNYRDHVAEVKAKVPDKPVLFSKFNNTLLAHNGSIKLPVEVAKKFDYEVELVIVMGKRAKNVGEADALSYVAGYATGNDFSARDLQQELAGGQWMIGKTPDGFAPVGPYIVTADQVDPANLSIECRVNGQTRQNSNTKNMIFDTKAIVSYVSKHMTLEPGDIIYTGTPPGVIGGMPEDKKKWLVAGDVVSCSLQGLGELTFKLT
jgi:2-keto-4-pentenoate hydratase/2-oxohepta-3-ene-1,7-dioic acid hydratase in catechol pathway